MSVVICPDLQAVFSVSIALGNKRIPLRISRKYLSPCFDLRHQSEQCDWPRIWLQSKFKNLNIFETFNYGFSSQNGVRFRPPYPYLLYRPAFNESAVIDPMDPNADTASFFGPNGLQIPRVGQTFQNGPQITQGLNPALNPGYDFFVPEG